MTKLTSLSPMQRKDQNIISNHFSKKDILHALRMIIQGSAITRKSHLINCIKEILITLASSRPSLIMLLTTTGIANFNIEAQTILSALQLPIEDLILRELNSLATLQEEIKHILYILIDEMSFIGPNFHRHIDEHLEEAFTLQRNITFSGCSIKLVVDIGQLMSIKHI